MLFTKRRKTAYRLFFMMLFFLHLMLPSTMAATQKIHILLKDAHLKDVFREIKRGLGYTFVYNDAVVDKAAFVSLDVNSDDIHIIMKECLKGTRLNYQIKDKVIVIYPPNEFSLFSEQKSVVLKGVVRDERGEAIPGASVRVKGNRMLGTSTNTKGEFFLNIPKVSSSVVLIFSFIGMETRELKVLPERFSESLDVRLKEVHTALDNVVVTGYGTIRKSSFTGNAVKVNREDILKVSSRNLINVLQVFDPSLRVMKNNEMGSDPNTLPEFYIRGRSGIGIMELDKQELSQSFLRNNPNTPVFILDGYEVDVQKIYDFDPNLIESVTILKDAAATAIYGSRAANGVIVIETKALKPGGVQIAYMQDSELTVPDLSDYNLMNAEEKLEAERLAGLYESQDEKRHLALQTEYLKKKNNILRGVYTDWPSLPLHNVFNHKHGLYIKAGSKEVSFGADLSYDNQKGVMKGSFRNRIGTGFYISYRINKLQIKNHVTFDIVKGLNSPYGDFATYTRLMPYDTYKDDDGFLLETLPLWHTGQPTPNPLYDAEMTKSFSRLGYNNLTNNLSIDWYIYENIRLRSQFSITKKNYSSEDFKDPDSGIYKDKKEGDLKGDLWISKSENISWNANIVLNYLKEWNKHYMNFSLGVNARENKIDGIYSRYRGFPSGALNSPNYAQKIDKKPSFNDNHTRLFGSFLFVNYTYDNIYLLDISCRLDGSSEFGTKKKFAPFWSSGIGVNLHNYDFLKDFPIITNLKIRCSYGQTGKTNFPPYAAKHTYNVMDKWYSTGNGVFITYLGNDHLKWERTNMFDMGMDIGILKDRLLFKFSWYNKKTIDLITDVTLPASTGFIVYKENLGEVLNRGYELDAHWTLFRNKDWHVIAYGNLSHNKNKILKISESLKAYNDRVDLMYEGYAHSQYTKADLKYAKPLMKYKEGGSLTSIWGMKSLGINPTDGNEIYILENGRITYEWNSHDQMILGDTEPDARGAFGLNISYKGFSLFASFLYEFGGQIYNQTLVNKVENVDLYSSNADRRVLTERWKQFGEMTRLKALAQRGEVSRSTSRFVQNYNAVDFNSFSLGYDIDSKILKKAGLSMLRIKFGMKDVSNISTVRRERGLNYPYARTFNLNLNATF